MLSRSAQTKGANYQSTERTTTHTHAHTHSHLFMATKCLYELLLSVIIEPFHWPEVKKVGYNLLLASFTVIQHRCDRRGGEGSRSDFKKFCEFFQNACKHVEESRRVYIFNRTFQKQDNVKHKARIVHTSASVSFMNTHFTMWSGLSVDTQPDFLDTKTTAFVKKNKKNSKLLNETSTSLFVQLVPLI